MEQLPEGLIGPGLLIIKSVCSDYDYLTVTMVFICVRFFGLTVDLFILKTFLLLVFKCYKDHECSYTYVHAAMVGRVMWSMWCWVHAFGG